MATQYVGFQFASVQDAFDMADDLRATNNPRFEPLAQAIDEFVKPGIEELFQALDEFIDDPDEDGARRKVRELARRFTGRKRGR